MILPLLSKIVVTPLVMPALGAGIHALLLHRNKAWMAGTSPAMTVRREFTP
jgi:hypothetical protein